MAYSLCFGKGKFACHIYTAEGKNITIGGLKYSFFRNFFPYNLISMPWTDKINDLRDIISRQEPNLSWASSGEILDTLSGISRNLERDIAALKKDCDYVFSEVWDREDHTARTVQVFRDWHEEGKSPSLTAICIFAMGHFGLLDHDIVKAVLLASVLGEVDNSLPYHNNMHYRIVTFQMICMIVRHNEIYAGSDDELSGDQILTLLTASCIHDLGHDGRGNTDGEGVHHPSRTERRSFNLARPYLESCGCDENVLNDIGVLLICTDVSPLLDPNSPVSQMKRAYRYHFLGGRDEGFEIYLDGALSVLRERRDLALMGLLMHEADIATSAGLDYTVTKYETKLYRDEIGSEQARPQHVVDFLDRICQGQMLSQAGKTLFALNLDRIYARAKEDISKGDIPYQKPEESEFMQKASSS